MQSFKIEGQKLFTALNHSPMGYSVPASVGAFFADKKKNIITIIGDGSMQMNIQELETIKHYKVNTKIFIIIRSKKIDESLFSLRIVFKNTLNAK